uniref:PARP catalytic domain-containing protein n=1 Tax=Astyanax mexicanus TaxID=7994 RepID=A0A3B1K180_ASTMX
MDQLSFTIGSQRSYDTQYNQIYTMYHGTTLSNALPIARNGFIPSSGGMLGPGVYVSRSFYKACAYPQFLPPNDKGVVLKIRVRVGKVKKINYHGHPIQFTWHQHGYDTAWVPPMCGMVPSGVEEDCVWDPKRIEYWNSIFNPNSA